MVTRRQFLKAIMTSAVVGVGLYTWQVEPHWLEVVERALPIRGLPTALAGRRLVQLSDIHVGPRVSDNYVRDTFRRAAALGPDIVIYTGDFISYEPTTVAHADRIYREAPRGRLATLGILGNHDYGPGWSHPEIAARLAAQLRVSGVQILRNEIVDVEGLQIVGLDDFWGGPVRHSPRVRHARPIPCCAHADSQSRHRRSVRMGALQRVDSRGTHARRAVQAAVPAAPAGAGAESTIHGRRVCA